METFWSFVNMIQILFYFRLMNIMIPPNLNFVYSYLNVAKLEIPFIPNIFVFLNLMNPDPLNERFMTCGLKSISFLYNFGQKLFIWCIVAISYSLLLFLHKSLPRKRFHFIRKLKSAFEFNAMLRTIIETYQEFTIAVLLNIFHMNIDSLQNLLSLSAAIVSLVRI